MATRAGSPFLSALLGLLSVALLPIALAGLWVSVMLTRSDVFVDETRPLISTPAVQSALAEGVTSGVLTQLALAPGVEQLVEPLIREGAERVVASPDMASVWATSMGALHQEFVAVMEGRAAAGLDDQGRVVIAVPIRLPALAPALAPFGVIVDPALAPVVTIPVAPVDNLEQVRLAYSVLDTVGVWGPVAVLGLGVLAVALARRRRGAARLIVTGWMIGAAGLGVALVAARQPLVDQVADPTVRALANAAYGMAQRGLLTEIGVVLGVSLILLLVLRVGRRGRVSG